MRSFYVYAYICDERSILDEERKGGEENKGGKKIDNDRM